MFRQFRALSKKNFLTWRRTPMSSLFELVFPPLLMVLLIVLRNKIPPKNLQSDALQRLIHPLYPVELPPTNDSVSDWIQYMLNAAVQQSELSDFANYTGYVPFQSKPEFSDIEQLLTSSRNETNSTTYIPMTDFLGPYYFFPPHCFTREPGSYSSPIIAYIKTGNPLEDVIIRQIDGLFAFQRQLKDEIIARANSTANQTARTNMTLYELDQQLLLQMNDTSNQTQYGFASLINLMSNASQETNQTMDLAAAEYILMSMMKNETIANATLGQLLQDEELRASLRSEVDGIDQLLDQFPEAQAEQQQIFQERLYAAAEQLKEFPEFGNFTLKQYSNISELEEYISNPKYGQPEFPGICYGFSFRQTPSDGTNGTRNGTKYELQLMFNDLPPFKYQSIPSQIWAHFLTFEPKPQIIAYAQYSWYGFAYMQNWVANIILKSRTFNSASIAALTVPYEMKSNVFDEY